MAMQDPAYRTDSLPKSGDTNLRDLDESPLLSDQEVRRASAIPGDLLPQVAVFKLGHTNPPMPITLAQARAAKGAFVESFAQVVDVVAVGITRLNGGYAVKVNLRSDPSPSLHLPASLNGVPIRVVVTGSIFPQRL
jgi:hypothetical protein